MKINIKKDIWREIFYFLSATLILFFGAELIWPNSVLSYIDINRVILLWFLNWLLLL